MGSQTLEWYLQQGAGRKILTGAEERGKLQRIEAQKNILYHTINSRDSRFIDTYFPAFREREKEDNLNRWVTLDSIKEKYLDFVAWKLGEYPDSYEDFIPRKGKILTPGTKGFQQYKRQQERIPPLYQDWHDSMKEFVSHNMGLGVSIAKRFRNGRIPLEDLAQFAAQGLLRALYSFDRSRGLKFATYASWWVQHAVLRSILDTGSTIRLPAYAHDILRQVKQAKSRLQQKNESENISIEELAAETGFDADIISNLLQCGEPSSLDNELDKEKESGSKTFQDYLEDTSSVSTFDQVSDNQNKRILHKALETLNHRELAIIKSRFGLGRGEETFQQLGTRYGLSRERMRQLEVQALRRLRGNPHLQELRKA